MTSPARSPAKRSRSASTSSACPSTASRVAVDVEVVVGALSDAAQRLQLGQDDGGHAELVEQGEAAQRVGAADQQAQLGELALPGRLGSVGGFDPGQGGGSAGRPRGRARPPAVQRGAGAAGRRRNCERRPARRNPRLEVGEAAVRVERLAAASGTAIAFTVKSRAARSASIVSPRSAAASICQAAVAARPRARSRTRPRARRRARRRSRAIAFAAAARIAGDGEVDVGRPRGRARRRGPRRRRSRPPAPPLQRPPRQREPAPPSAPAIGGGSRRAARGTRGEIPQVIS